MLASVVLCPHCIRPTPVLGEPKVPRCRRCRGKLAFEDFHGQMLEIAWLETLYNLEDKRRCSKQ